MAVSPHPSVRPTPPTKPPAVAPTIGHSGQPGVEYGARHNMHIKSPNSSEMAHHFTSSEGHAKHAGHKESNEGGHGGKSGRPGDEKSNDEPG